MHPSSGLLYSDTSPLILSEKFVSVDFFVDISGEDDVTIFIVVVLVLVGVLDLVWVVGHLNIGC